MGDPSKRLEMLETMIDKGSADPFVHYAHAMEHRSQGDLVKALELFGAVAERFGDYVPTYLMAAQVAEKLDRLDDAKDWAERGLQRARNAGDAHAQGELQAFLDEL
jgi:tetratricopeptide (TPR) repeat protein